MAPPNFVREGRALSPRGGGFASARLAQETKAERTTHISKKARHCSTLSHHNPRSSAWFGLLLPHSAVTRMTAKQVVLGGNVGHRSDIVRASDAPADQVRLRYQRGRGRR
jgi:hypothetical protein